MGALGAAAGGNAPLSPIGQIGQAGLGATAMGQQPLSLNPLLAGALGAQAQAAQQQFGQNIATLRQPFIQAGQTGLSSPEMTSLGQAAATFGTGLQANLANQLLQASQQGQQNQLAAAQAAMTAGLTGQQNAITAAQAALTGPQQIQSLALQAAGIPQQTQQAQLAAQYQDFLRQQQQQYAALQVPGVGNLIGQTGVQMPDVYGQSPFQSLVGGVLPLALAASVLGYRPFAPAPTTG